MPKHTTSSKPNSNIDSNIKSNSKTQLNESDKLKRAIIAGSVLAGIYFFDKITADEWYEKDKDGKLVFKQKDLFDEIFK